jgi:Mlc titration factor MtfA (ptsG expression regulator)
MAIDAIVWTGALALLIGLPLWLPGWRLKRALAQPIAPSILALLERDLPVYRRMAPPLQQQLQRLVQQFLYQKKFVGCDGLEITDEIRVSIAAQACLLLLNRPSRVYPKLHTILVYPGAFMAPRQQVDGAGVITETRQDLLGESWGDGRVVLSWDHVQHGARDWTDGQNVVLHEFAHQLDSESGSNNGAPYLGSSENYRSWSAVLSRDFANLRAGLMYGGHAAGASVIDRYGATSPAEFFAVATETFYEKPHQMADVHGALYEELMKYYRVDPRAWCSPPAPVFGDDLGNLGSPSFGATAGNGFGAMHGASYGQWQ